MISQKNFIGYDAIIAEKVSQLQYFQKQEVFDFINFLLSKSSIQNEPTNRKVTFEWEGALKKMFSNISSVELQHNIWEL
ncbi:MAG: DUF2281 domain-containing protein [Bacteroidetes bacterium]|nr:DUF2281 domain-containing protein [Bacteroidota bacterium]